MHTLLTRSRARPCNEADLEDAVSPPKVDVFVGVKGNHENGVNPHHLAHHQRAYAFSPMWTSVLVIDHAARRTRCHLGKSTLPLALHASYDALHNVEGNHVILVLPTPMTVHNRRGLLIPGEVAEACIRAGMRDARLASSA